MQTMPPAMHVTMQQCMHKSPLFLQRQHCVTSCCSPRLLDTSGMHLSEPKASTPVFMVTLCVPLSMFLYSPRLYRNRVEHIANGFWSNMGHVQERHRASLLTALR